MKLSDICGGGVSDIGGSIYNSSNIGIGRLKITGSKVFKFYVGVSMRIPARIDTNVFSYKGITFNNVSGDVSNITYTLHSSTIMGALWPSMEYDTGQLTLVGNTNYIIEQSRIHLMNVSTQNGVKYGYTSSTNNKNNNELTVIKVDYTNDKIVKALIDTSDDSYVYKEFSITDLHKYARVYGQYLYFQSDKYMYRANFKYSDDTLITYPTSSRKGIIGTKALIPPNASNKLHDESYIYVSELDFPDAFNSNISDSIYYPVKYVPTVSFYNFMISNAGWTNDPDDTYFLSNKFIIMGDNVFYVRDDGRIEFDSFLFNDSFGNPDYSTIDFQCCSSYKLSDDKIIRIGVMGEHYIVFQILQLSY